MRPAVPLAALLASAPAVRPAAAERPLRDVPPANGLTVIVHEDHSAPIVSVNCWYHVGSGRETPGRTGFAHLFEHLMFEGSKNVPEGAFDRWLEAVGGDNNGSTENDRTNYWENAPANALESPLFLESDRMGFLLDAMSPAKVDGQRDVVKNERRARGREPALRPGRGPDAARALPEGPPVLVAGHRLDGGPLGRELPGRRRFLQEVVRARERQPGRRGRRGPKRGAAPRGEVVRRRAEERARRPHRSPAGRAAGGEAPGPRGRGPAPPALLAWVTPPAFAPGDAALDAVAGRAERRQELAALQATRLRAAGGPGRVGAPGQRRARFDLHRRGDRAGRPRPRGDPPPRGRGDRAARSPSPPPSGS